MSHFVVFNDSDLSLDQFIDLVKDQLSTGGCPKTIPYFLRFFPHQSKTSLATGTEFIPPSPTSSMSTTIAICGSSYGAYAVNQAWDRLGSFASNCAVPVFPAEDTDMELRARAVPSSTAPRIPSRAICRYS